MTHTIDSLMDDINTLRKEIARLQYAERFYQEVERLVELHDQGKASTYHTLLCIGSRLDELYPDYDPE